MFYKSVILFGIVIFVTTSQSCKNSEESPVVSASAGTFKGSIIESRLGKNIYSFKGIKYARAPVGDLRFKPPVPVDKFQDVYDATEDPPFCPQPTTQATTSEDCLFLSVYSTKLPSEHQNGSAKRPVVVFLHPGGFYTLAAAYFQPQYLLDQDVVLVTVNYRLATLGFLATGTKEAPGNNGLKDQVVALKWIKHNIEAFGGDSNSITLTGCSAGGIGVVLHMLSPMSRGLFHRGISFSNSPTKQKRFGSEQVDLARVQAQLVGCPEGNVSEVVGCLRRTPAKDLGDSLWRFFGREFYYDPVLQWAPVVEPDFGQERFLPEEPTAMIQKGNFQKLPLIVGITANEFDSRAIGVIANDTALKRLNEEFEEVAPIAFQYERNTSNSRAISRSLKKFYFGDSSIDNSSTLKLGQLYSDSIIGFPVHRLVKLMGKKNTEPTYYYKFSYQGSYSFNYIPGTNKTYGVAHQDDLIYLFYMPLRFPLFQRHTPKEIEMVGTLTKLYANYAKFGKPTLGNLTWEPYNPLTQRYLDIGKTLMMKSKLYEDRYAEWDRLFPLD